MKYLILHGVFGSADSNWFPWLKEELEKLNHNVLLPQMPSDDYEEAVEIYEKNGSYSSKHQTRQIWFNYFEKEILPWIGNSEEVVVVGHSLAPLFTLHLIEKYEIKFDSGIFVSPFYEKVGLDNVMEVVNDDYYYTGFDFKKINELLPISYAIFSDNDPYLEIKYIFNFVEKVGSVPIMLKGGEHLGGVITEFPLVLDLCKGRDNYLKSEK